MVRKVSEKAVAAAVKEVVDKAQQEAEESKLEAEIAALEESMDVDAIPDLADTGIQQVRALLEEFVEWDRQRQVNKIKTAIAREAGDVEGAKALIAAKPRVLKHLNIILRKLVDVLGVEDDVRDEMVNWLAMPVNLRSLLAKHLLERKGLDVSEQVKRANDIEDERRNLRRLTHQER